MKKTFINTYKILKVAFAALFLFAFTSNSFAQILICQNTNSNNHLSYREKDIDVIDIDKNQKKIRFIISKTLGSSNELTWSLETKIPFWEKFNWVFFNKINPLSSLMFWEENQKQIKIYGSRAGQFNYVQVHSDFSKITWQYSDYSGVVSFQFNCKSK